MRVIDVTAIAGADATRYFNLNLSEKEPMIGLNKFGNLNAIGRVPASIREKPIFS